MELYELNMLLNFHRLFYEDCQENYGICFNVIDLLSISILNEMIQTRVHVWIISFKM